MRQPLPHLKPNKKIPPPFSIRFTFDERARLEREAGNRPLAAHIRTKLFGNGVSHSRNRPVNKPRQPTADEAALARLLAALGRSHIASNLNQIAKAANMGALPVTPDLLDELNAACAEIRRMRCELIAALGLREGGE